MMSTQTTEQVKSFFHGYAKSFDGIYMRTTQANVFGRFVDRLFRKSMFIRFNKTMDELRNKEIVSVLDIGCGSGRYAVEYLALGKKVLGIDLAPGMLEMAESVCKEWYPNGNYKFILGDYMGTILPETYDAAVLMGLFDYIQDPVGMLKKLGTDVTKRILASFPKSGGILGMQRKIRYNFRNCPLYLYSRSELEETLKKAGMNCYEIIESDREFFVQITLDSVENK